MDHLIYYDEITQSLSKAVYHAYMNLKNMNGLLRMTIQSGMWRERISTVTGGLVEFKTFEEYVSAKPPEGLGTDIGILKLLCTDDKELIDLIDSANEIQTPPVRLPHEASGVQKKLKHLSKDWTIQKLTDENRLDLVRDLLMGKLTPYAIQMEMGWRKKRSKTKK